MLTNNNNTPSSAPPPPPPPPPDWKNTCKHNNKNGKSPSVTAEKSSSGNKPRRDQSKSPVQQSSLDFAENPLFKKKQKEHNVNSETADEGSKNSIHVKNSETRNSAQSKEEDNASDKTKNDRINTKQSVQKKTMTEQHNGVHSDSKNQESSLAKQKKATSLKCSIAILLLFTSGAVAGVCTYFMISAVLSGVAVPVLFAVIASVSALVMFSSAAYLINSHLSAINSEKKVDPGRKQSQDLQKAKELEHSNTPTPSSPKMSGTSSTSPPPPLPPVKSNDLSTALRVTRKSSPSDANQKNVQQKQSNTPVDARSDLLAAIRQPRTLKKVPDEEKRYLPKDDLKIPQKQEEESTPGKQENGVHPLNNGVYQNQSQNSNLQEAKKLEHSKSEDMQQTNILGIAIQKQRRKNGFQDEQLDSLGEQEDSFCSWKEPFTQPKKIVNQEQKCYTQTPNIAEVLHNKMSSAFLLPESPINNLSSNSANVLDDADWPTQPDSILDIYTDKTRKQERVKDRDNYPYSASSPTKPDEVQDSPSPSVSECIGKFGRTTHKGQPQSCIQEPTKSELLHPISK